MWWAKKDAVIGRPDAVVHPIGLVSHHLGRLLDAIELTICVHLYKFVCRVGYFDAQIRVTVLYK
jgi:hypothetical protein